MHAGRNEVRVRSTREGGTEGHRTETTTDSWENRVVVQVSAEIVKPLPDRPYEGFLVLSSEISPMASISYEAGR